MWTEALPARARATAEALWLMATAGSTGSQSPVELLWVGQAVTLLVALVTAWGALRSKKSEVGDSRQARFEKRLDEELDDQRTLTRQWQEAWAAEHVKILRYESFLLRHGIDLETGRRGVPDA